MNAMKAYYYVSVDVLKNFLSIIPDIELCNAKGYFGKVLRENGQVKKIVLSKFNLEVNKYEDEDIFDLIDTIAHELAHINYCKHNEEHKALTINYRKLILCKLLLDDNFTNKEMALDDKFYENSIIYC